MMQIYLKPSCRKMIMIAARQTENTINEVIVSGVACNPFSYDYKIKDYSLKSVDIEGTKRWKHS